ncbi:MAG: hypothetical protein AVDCRST_MAG17-444, partial [uncultured Solirubrobacterales bacterium]
APARSSIRTASQPLVAPCAATRAGARSPRREAASRASS